MSDPLIQLRERAENRLALTWLLRCEEVADAEALQRSDLPDGERAAILRSEPAEVLAHAWDAATGMAVWREGEFAAVRAVILRAATR